MTTECPTCNEEFDTVGMHWCHSADCTYPEFSEYQKEVITGLLMGDGYVLRTEGGNPQIRAEMITEEYLQYLDTQVFPVVGSGVSLFRTAEESFENTSKEFSPNKKLERYSDVYRWMTKCNPNIDEYAEWYSSGEKVFPDDIELTQTVLKHWYCGDGSYNTSQHNGHIAIGCSNEIERKEQLREIFSSKGCQPTFQISERNKKDGKIMKIRFTKQESEKLFEYMGKPLPGFEYKWPDEFTN